MEPVEVISWEGKPLTYIIRASPSPESSVFLTPPDLPLQVGFSVRRSAGQIARHVHPAVERRVVGSTAEVLVVREGRCQIDIYNDARQRVATRELAVGDVMLSVAGGHGFRMLEDTVLLEVKQGPYGGAEERERF